MIVVAGVEGAASTEPDHAAFARSVVGASYVLKSSHSFLSAVTVDKGTDPVDAIASDFAFVTKAFHLDLRSQKQVLKLFEAAVSGMSARPVYVFSLVFLACLLFRRRAVFERVASLWSGSGSIDRNGNVFEEAGFHDSTIRVKTQTRHGEPGLETRDVSASEIMMVYVDAARRNLDDLVRVADQDRVGVYPDLLRKHIAHEAVTQPSRPDKKSSASDYPLLLRAAGQIS